MGLFDDSFDIDAYVRKRLMEMDDLKNRELFKEIIVDMMCGMYEHIKEEYQLLENRVFKETPLPERMPDIVTGLSPLDAYDVTDKYMHPMDTEDLEPKKIFASSVLTSLQEGKPFFLYTCFLPEDYADLKKLVAEERIFHGLMETQMGEIPTDFVLKPNRHYQKLVEEIYPLAALNCFPWRSINAPYLYKLFDVYAVKTESEDEIQEVQEITKITVELEEFAEKACHTPVPLWNLNPVTITANSYPQPALERGYFEHILYRSQFKEDSAYLLRHSPWAIRGMRRMEGDLYILCDGETPGDWEFFEVNRPDGKTPYAYPLMSNAQRDTFSLNMIEHYGQRIKTRADINRFVLSFPCAEALELTDVTVVPNTGKTETYSMEAFIDYEFRSGNRERALTVTFHPKDEEFFLNRDIMSFLMTGLQHYFPEYECVGRLL